MPPKPDAGYTPYGTVSAGGGGGEPLPVRANPNDFGGQVGEAVQGLGAVGEKAGEEGINFAIKQQGMINETMASNAETAYLAKLGELNGSYRSLDGLQAVQARPKFIQDVTDLRQSMRAQLPAGAAHAFDMLAVRHEGYMLNDANMYAASQIKKADRDSAVNGVTSSVMSAASPTVASDDKQFGSVIGDIKFNTNRQFNNTHEDHIESQDPATGSLVFKKTPEGITGEQLYKNAIDTAVGQANYNRYSSLADLDVMAAYKKYNDNKAELPRQSQVQLDAFFFPRVMEHQTKIASGVALANAQAGYTESYISSAGSSPNNLGNVKTPEGARNNTQDFVHPATPVDGVMLAANTLRNGYSGMTLEEIGHKWTSTDKDNWVKNVSAASGLDPKSVPNLDDPQQLSALLRGISVAEKSPGDRTRFTPDVISQGVQSAIAGGKPNTQIKEPGSIPPPSQADYYRSNYATILHNAAEQAEKTRPGDIEFAERVRTNVERVMNDVIRTDEMRSKTDGDLVYRAFSGDLSKGQKPTSVDQLTATSPDVKEAWGRLLVSNPHMADIIERNILTANSKETDKDTKEYGSKYLELYHQIHPAAGTAPSITDVSQLYPHVGNGLTQAGMNQLQKEIQADEGTKGLKVDTYKMVEGRISKKDPLTGLADPEGETRAIKAHYAMDKYWSEQKAAGATETELLDPSNKKWIGNVGLAYKRDPAKEAADLRASNAPVKADEATFVKKLSADLDAGKYPDKLKAIQSAYMAKHISKDTAVKLANSYKVIQQSEAAPQNAPAQVPRPEE